VEVCSAAAPPGPPTLLSLSERGSYRPHDSCKGLWGHFRFNQRSLYPGEAFDCKLKLMALRRLQQSSDKRL